MKLKTIKTLFAIAFAVVCTSTANALEAYLSLENDSPFNKDADYTHGTEFEFVTEKGWHYMVSQTMYAPYDLSLKEHRYKDRPYCGMLLGGVGYEFFQRQGSPWTNYGELDFGVIGPAAFCKQTQKFVHKVLDCRKPMGWDNQLHNEVVLNGQWWTKYNYYLTDWLAFVPKAGVALGTIEDFTEVGADLKIGWNIRPTVNNEIIFSAPSKSQPRWKRLLSAYAYIGASERFYLYNHMLEGSMFGGKDKDLDANVERFVTEVRGGAVLSYGRFYMSIYALFRTDEYEGQKYAPNYGGLVVGWKF